MDELTEPANEGKPSGPPAGNVRWTVEPSGRTEADAPAERPEEADAPAERPEEADAPAEGPAEADGTEGAGQGPEKTMAPVVACWKPYVTPKAAITTAATTPRRARTAAAPVRWRGISAGVAAARVLTSAKPASQSNDKPASASASAREKSARSSGVSTSSAMIHLLLTGQQGPQGLAGFLQL
ncbi:hypothetical protein ACQP2X_49305 [Actinoplanes sp. CA-131856]